MRPELRQHIIDDFISYCIGRLGIEGQPQIQFVSDREWAATNRSFGAYDPQTDSITIYVGNRNLADSLRTLAHELVHHRQRELGKIQDGTAGQTGSPIENEANALAGVLMRDYGKTNDLIYESFFPTLKEIYEVEKVLGNIAATHKNVISKYRLSEIAYKFSESDVMYDEEDDSLLDVEYTFSTVKNTPYRVVFSSKEKPRNFNLSFGIDTGRLNKIDTFQMAGEGDAKNILETVAEIVNEFYNEYSNEIDKIIISGTSEKRTRVYKKFLPKYIDPKIMSKIEIK